MSFHRFWGHVRLPEGCWEWTASTSAGYGQFSPVHDQTVKAHRYMWEHWYGPIPFGLDVLHKCNNPICVRPDHLKLGTDQENTEDKRVVDHVLAGERHPRAKLTDAQVAEALARWAAGEKPSLVARSFGISYPHLWSLRANGRRG